jgi:LuxR family maltose regulon positive regulatory protein
MSDTPSAWLSLDERDDDLVTFLTYFITAIQTMFPAACRDTLALLNAATLPPLDVLSRSLINELDQLEPAFTLVLDDFYFILDPAIHDLLNDLVRYPPRPLHLVVISRSDPSLPITTLRARGQVTEIRSRELRFTVAETGALLQQMQGVAPEQTTAAHLTEKTEGWVTGIRLAILALRKQGDLDGLLNRLPENLHQHVADYLLAEVVSDQPAAIQAFLLKTSILSRLNGPLCDVMADLDEPEGNGQATLEWLREARLFTLPLRDQPGSYRYHHLFQEHLQNQLEHRYDPADVATLHARASSWFAQAAFVDEALHHALTAGDALAAAQIVERTRLATLAADRWYMLEKWLDRLPHEIKMERPGLLLAQAHISIYSTRLGEIPPIIERADSLLDLLDDDAHEPTLLAEMNFFRGLICYLQGEGARSVEFLTKAIALLPQSSSGHLWGHFEMWLGMALHLSGRKESAIRRLNEGIRTRNYWEPVVLSRLNFGLCFIHVMAGEWIQVWQQGLQFKEVSRSNGLIFSEAWANYMLGNASLQRFELEKAHYHFSLVVENRYVSNHRAAVDGMAGLALTLQLMGEGNEADEMMRLAHEFAQWTPDPGNLEIIRSCQARLALLRGDLDSAARWQHSLSETTKMPMFFFLENPSITQCRVLIAMGTKANLEKAAQKLQQLRQVTDATHNTCQMVEIIALQAVAFHQQGHLDEALRVLEQAVATAVPGGWIRPFVELGSPMADLLAQLQSQSVTLDYTRQILAAFPAFGFEVKSSDPNRNLPNPLTPRELQTLQLLATDLSVADIAAEMVVSVATVRTHTKRIYSKLNIHSRDGAVQRANELALF